MLVETWPVCRTPSRGAARHYPRRGHATRRSWRPRVSRDVQRAVTNLT